MSRTRARSSWLPLPLAWILSCSTPGGEAQGKAFPAGSEKAVSAVRTAIPDAVVSEVSVPKDFGADAGDGQVLFWSIKLRSHQTDKELRVTPDGLIVLLPRPIEEGELPSPVRDAVNREAAGATVLRRERQETRATLRYTALARPEVSYIANVSAAGASKRLELTADGQLQHSIDLGSHDEAGQEAEESPKPSSDQEPKEADVPSDAARAVAAVRALVPGMVFRGVEVVGYLDGTSEMEVLNYEVEFFLEGVAKEWNATPDGIVIQVPKPIALEATPAPVRRALTKDGAWKIDKLVQEETRAGLKFVALPTPKVVYLVDLEKDGKTRAVRFRADGTKIEEINPMAMLGK